MPEMGEFGLIERIRQRSRDQFGAVVGIGDDAAVLRPTAGCDIVATTDSLIPKRHFMPDWPAADVGYLAMQSNLSDLAAMGATPRWALLALTLPEYDRHWLDAFLDGFLEAAQPHAVGLVGGNLARGNLNVCTQLIGEVDQGRAVTRTGARPGDRLVVTGTPGDAAAALALGQRSPRGLTERLRRPTARMMAGAVLARQARAMIDLSDGLTADLGRLLTPPLGAELRLDQLPASPALERAINDPERRRELQLAGGSDYELLVVLPGDLDMNLVELSHQAGVSLTEIGRVTDSGRLIGLLSGQAPVEIAGRGWDHFRDE